MRFQFTTRDWLWAAALIGLLCLMLFRGPLNHGWRKGPLPPNTYGWGGVVPTWSTSSDGFYFADFRGDHVEIPVYMNGVPAMVRRDQVRFYNNDLTMPFRDKYGRHVTGAK